MLRACILLLTLGLAGSSKILAFLPYPSYSHQITFQPILRELSLRGHQVTSITPNPLKDVTLKNLTEVDVHDVSYDVWNRNNVSSLGVQAEDDSMDLTFFYNVLGQLMDAHLSHPEIRRIFSKGKKGDFDLVLVEMAFPAVFLKDVYDCPLILMSSLPMNTLAQAQLGNPAHPALYPDFLMPFTWNLSFVQRLQSAYSHLTVDVAANFYRIVENKIRTVLPEVRDSREIVREASMMISNTNPLLNVARPNVPSVVEFSGMHIKPPKPLPADLQRFLDDAKQGAIYVSFGSNIKSSTIPKEKLMSILTAISELPYKFLWKFEADNLPLQPPNLLVQKWLPQQDVLRHPNLNLFVTQGGLQSLDEAMYTGTPVVVVPFFGDQIANARKIVDVGMGVSLRYRELTKEALKEAVLEVLGEKYLKRAGQLRDIVTDKPMSALDKVTWSIEHVLRHRGAGHLRAPQVPVYQYYFLDVMAFIVLLLTAVVLTVVKVGRFLVGLYRRKLKQS